MTGPGFRKGFWTPSKTGCICDPLRLYAGGNVLPIIHLFTELRPVCGRCGGDAVVLCGLTYEGEEQVVVLRDYGFDYSGRRETVERIRKRRCINGNPAKLPEESAED